MTKGTKKRYIIWGLFLVILAVAVVAVVLNRQRIYDFFRGLAYQPSSEMVGIRRKLSLTDEGTFLFNASQPELNSREEFNENCRFGEDLEIAVLGCYVNGDIHIYDIRSEELNGIKELTTAHELLHAVYARMSDGDKAILEPLLESVYATNKDVLESDIDTYDEAAKMEELYVRAGTEIKDLPKALEDEYARVFEDQDAVVAYYEGYIAVFREVEAELEALTGEMEALTAEIEQKTTEYERRFAQLDADIVSFNSCAEVAGCFKTEDEFYARRSGLVAEQGALGVMYEELNGLIDQYNQKVEAYNNEVLRSNELNRMINSSERPETL